jgi:hypothetical protein
MCPDRRSHDGMCRNQECSLGTGCVTQMWLHILFPSPAEISQGRLVLPALRFRRLRIRVINWKLAVLFIMRFCALAYPREMTRLERVCWKSRPNPVCRIMWGCKVLTKGIRHRVHTQSHRNGHLNIRSMYYASVFTYKITISKTQFFNNK